MTLGRYGTHEYQRAKHFSDRVIIAISIGLFFFGRLLAPSDLNAEQPPIRKTITAIVSANQTIEALIHETETADIHECFCQTFTPEPETMTAIAEITATYGITSMMTQAAIFGVTYVPRPTLNAAQPTLKTETSTPVPSS